MNDALKTDLYEIAMAGALYRTDVGSQRYGVAEMFVRRMPENRNYLIAMGADTFADAVMDLQFTNEDIAYLSSIPMLKGVMTESFKEYLRLFRFRGTIEGLPEGTVFFANEPIVRIEGNLIELTLLETLLLSTVNFQTAIATKAARMVQAAGGRQLMEFGSRRTHPDAAVQAARAAYLAGFDATSNLRAGQLYGIPVTGTMAHYYVMAQGSEQRAFSTFSEVMDPCTLLIDTYDSIEGVLNAMAVVPPHRLAAVRIDSGDLGDIAVQIRQILNMRGYQATKIVVSGDLNEHLIATLAGYPIDGYGVGTDLVTSRDSPTVGGVYKLVEVGDRGVAKKSDGKITYPHTKLILRKHNKFGRIEHDQICRLGEPKFDDLRLYQIPIQEYVVNGDRCTLEAFETVRMRAKMNAASAADVKIQPEMSPGLQKALKECLSEQDR